MKKINMWPGVVSAMAIAVCASTAQASQLPDILVNHDGLYNGVQDTSGPAGGTFTYRAKVKHNSGDDATGVVLTQVLPVGAIYDSRSSQPSGISCSNVPSKGTKLTSSNNTITCTIGDLVDGGGFKWVDFNVILPSVSSTWKAYASAALPDPDGINDGDGSTNNFNLERNFTTNNAVDFGVKLTSDAPSTGVNNGDPYNYQIQVTNYGPTILDAGGFARVTFQVPAGAPIASYAALSGNGWTCTPASGPQPANAVISCDFLASTSGFGTGSYGAGYDLPPLTIPVQSQMGGPIGAAVSVEGFSAANTPFADGQLNNNTDSLIVQSTGTDYTDVSLTKTASPSQLDSANATPVEFTLKVKRESGALPPEQIVVTDTLPTGLTFDSLSSSNDGRWSCTHPAQGNAGTITCTWDGNAAFAGAAGSPLPDIKFTANAATGTDGGTIINTASVKVKDGTEPNTANNIDRATLTYSNRAQLSLNKTGPQRPVKKDAPFDYTLTITNDGPMTIASGKTFTLTEKPGSGLTLTGISLAPAGAINCDSSFPGTPLVGDGTASTDCVITLGQAFEKGQSLTVTVNAEVDDAGGNHKTFANTASIGANPGDRLGETVSSTTNITVSDTQADLELTKTVKSGPANGKSGDEVTYSITVTNKSGSTQNAQAVKITDVLNNLVVKDDLKKPDGTFTYPNGGFISAVVDSSPAGRDVQCSTPTGNENSRSRTLTCTVDVLAPGESVVIDVTIRPRVVTATPTATDKVEYKNSASAFSPYIHDPTISDNTDEAVIELTTLVDMTVKKQVSPTDEVAAGQPATYTVTLQNLGPSSAQGVKMEDTLPANAILVGEPTIPSGTGGSCYHDDGSGNTSTTLNGKQGGQLICSFTNAVPAGQQRVISYKLRSEGGNPKVGETLKNVVRVSTDTEETDSTNNEAEVEIALKPAELDVQIQMSHDDDGLIEGEEVEYTITIKNDNASSSYATNVVMTDLFPAAGSTATFSYVAGSLQLAGVPTSKAGYVSGVTASMDAALCGTVPAAGATSGTLQCTIPLMAPGDTVNIKFRMKAEALPAGRTTGTIFHDATVKPAETEHMPGYDALANNDTADRTSTSNRTSRPGTDVALEKEGPTGFPRAGETVMYTVTVFNYGTNPSPAGTMADTLPTGLGFVSAKLDGNNITCTPSGSTVTCALPVLPKGGKAVYTIETKVADPFTGSYPLINKAKANVAGDEDPANDEDETSTQPSPTPVPVDNPLALLALILGMGWIARRFHMRKHA